MPNPPNNNDLQRERIRFLNQSLSLSNIIKQGSVANSSRDNILPVQTPSFQVSPTVTQTKTATPTWTPTQTLTFTPTPSITNTPSITPTLTPSLTITTTPTNTITPSITPTVTVTLTITPTVTITPSISPDYSYITLQPLTSVGQDLYITGIENHYYDVANYNIGNFNGLYRVIDLNLTLDNNEYTYIQKYQFKDNFNCFIIGTSAFNIFNWNLNVINGIFNYNIFKSPNNVGNTSFIPFSGYIPSETSLPFYAVSGIKIYTDYNFKDIFARSVNSISALAVRGLTGVAFTSPVSSVNGLILYRDFNTSYPYYYGTNLFYNAFLAYFIDNVGIDYWWFEIQSALDQNFNAGFTGNNFFNSNSANLPFSGMEMDGAFLSDETNFRLLSNQIFQPNLQFLNANENYVFQLSPTPTRSLTPTPTVTPSLTPQNTPTPSITNTSTLTPTTTPTHTISPTPTLTQFNIAGIPVTFTNKISVFNMSGILYGIANNGQGTYTKFGDYNGFFYDSSMYYTFDTDNNAAIIFGNPGGGSYGGNNVWFLGYYSDNNFIYSVNHSPLSGNSSFIPTIGWNPSFSVSFYSN